MRRRKLKQFGFVLGLMLSLLASSSGACLCSHHREKAAETETPSCHGYGTESRHAKTASSDSSTETVNTSFSEGECCCVQPSAPKIVAKSESVKPEKQVAALPALLSATVLFAARSVSGQDNLQPKPLYLTDSFYNLTPGRAPPRL